ncbi:MAG: PDZ domain-containing protein [Phycisphaerales bacterium]|nr:PDZ domain-containing protein [Phycisphaerales bacterium]
MRRTTRPLAVTVLCLAGVALPMPGLAAGAAPASAPTARQPDDEYVRLLETALEGITIPGYTRGSIDDRDANAECVFRHPSGRVHPVSIRWNEPGWLDETWLGEPETVIVRDSIGLGDRSALIRGERGGLSMCGAFVVTGEIIISVGFANPRGPFTEEDQQRTLDLIEQMYENLRVAHGFDPSPDRPEPGPRGNDRPPPGRDEPVAPAGGLGDSSRDQLNQNRMSRLYQALLDADAPSRGMPDVDTLIRSGAIPSRLALVDARSPALTMWALGIGEPNRDAATMRLGSTWRDGPVATSDLPRDGAWLVLNGTGEVTTLPVDPAWLGQYEPRQLSASDAEAMLDRSAAFLGVYASDAETDSGRTGVGVDAVILGFTRQRHDNHLDADLRPGDLIVSIDGVRVESLRDLDSAITRLTPLDNDSWGGTPVEVIRDGQIVTTLPLRPASYIGTSDPRLVRDEAVEIMRSGGPRGEARPTAPPAEFAAGQLDADGLIRAARDEDVSVGTIMLVLEATDGPDAALDYIERRIDEGDRPYGGSELDLAQADQLARMGRTDGAMDVLIRMEEERNRQVAVDVTRATDRTGRIDMDAAIRERADLFADVWTARINALGSAGRIDDLMHEFDRVWHIAPGQMNAAGMAVYWLVHHGHFDVAADVIDLLRNLDGLDRGQRGVIEEVARRLMDLEREASGG